AIDNCEREGGAEERNDPETPLAADVDAEGEKNEGCCIEPERLERKREGAERGRERSNLAQILPGFALFRLRVVTLRILAPEALGQYQCGEDEGEDRRRLDQEQIVDSERSGP